MEDGETSETKRQVTGEILQAERSIVEVRQDFQLFSRETFDTVQRFIEFRGDRIEQPMQLDRIDLRTKKRVRWILNEHLSGLT